jgi:hypothetical protein
MKCILEIDSFIHSYFEKEIKLLQNLKPQKKNLYKEILWSVVTFILFSIEAKRIIDKYLFMLNTKVDVSFGQCQSINKFKMEKQKITDESIATAKSFLFLIILYNTLKSQKLCARRTCLYLQ